MKKYRRSMLLAAVFICFMAIGMSTVMVSANNKVSAGDWKLSDEKIEDSGYAFELTYQLMGEEVKYLYMTPDKGKFTGDEIEIGLNYHGNYYSYIKCNGLEMCINAGTCHVKCEKYSFVTNVFSLRQLP